MEDADMLAVFSYASLYYSILTYIILYCSVRANYEYLELFVTVDDTQL